MRNEILSEGMACCDEHELAFPYGTECPECERTMKETDKKASEASPSVDPECVLWGSIQYHRQLFWPDLDCPYCKIQAMREVIQNAEDWIREAPHGDNCYVSDHYEGDPGDRCNCGKESLLTALRLSYTSTNFLHQHETP